MPTNKTKKIMNFNFSHSKKWHIVVMTLFKAFNEDLLKTVLNTSLFGLVEANG